MQSTMVTCMDTIVNHVAIFFAWVLTADAAAAKTCYDLAFCSVYIDRQGLHFKVTLVVNWKCSLAGLVTNSWLAYILRAFLVLLVDVDFSECLNVQNVRFTIVSDQVFRVAAESTYSPHHHLPLYLLLIIFYLFLISG